jgi:hypothetical protein
MRIGVRMYADNEIVASVGEIGGREAERRGGSVKSVYYVFKKVGLLGPRR